MKRVLIADDDFLVCRFLTQIIDWERNGYELAGIARDGSQAMALIREQQPDILITDIEMPVMDGIELVRQIRKNGNPMKILILSCHDDLAHVKEGIRAGADEYFLKDELSGQKLLELLGSFSREMSSGESSSEAEEKHLIQLLEGTASEVSGSRANAVLAVHVTAYEERASLRTAEQREGFYRTFAAVLKSQVPDTVQARACHVRGGWFALLAGFDRNVGRQDQQYHLLELSNRILYQADRQFELTVQIGIAEAELYGGDMAAAWDQARALTGYAFYEKKQVFCSWQYRPMGNLLPAEASDFLEKAEEWRIRRDWERIRLSAEQTRKAFEQERTREPLVAAWLRNADEIFRIRDRGTVTQFEQLRELGAEYAAACVQKHPGEQMYSDSITEVIRYIQENYRSNLTLNDAAEAVHLTPTYLSYMFHKETEVTFSEYLQNCRIEHAKELLTGTEEKIRVIGELAGYNDYRHFCKTFKRVVGMTPQEYRKTR